MTRRAVVAHLDPVLERPELREFTGNPVDDVLADRGRYVAAALAVVRAYIVAGSPDTAPRLASFEGWSDTVRSALMWLGRADPVATMQQARVDDPRLAELRAVLVEWKGTLGEGKANCRTAGEVLRMIGEREPPPGGGGETSEAHHGAWQHPAFRDAVLAVASIRGRVDGRQFGKWLSQHKGRIVAGRRIRGESNEHGHPVKWYVESV